MLLMDEEEHENLECRQCDFNLSDSGDALIGFKGHFDMYVNNLAFYKATRIGYKIPKKQTKSGVDTGALRLASIKSDFSESAQNRQSEYEYGEEGEGEDFEYDQEDN